MSFITDDKDLATLLMYYGLSKEAQNAFQQTQMVGQSSSPEDQQNMTKLVDTLEQQLNSVISGPEIGTESDQDVVLNSNWMENLGTLVQFLARNKITVNGKRVVYDSSEDINDPAYPYFKLEGAAGILEHANRSTQDQYGYFLNKDLLVQYINSLRAQLIKHPNPVMNVQVESLIRDANQQLDANIDKFYHEPAKTLPPDALVDSVPKEIHTNAPIMGAGGVPLYFRDMASDTSFNSWVQGNQISVDRQVGKDANQCDLLKYLNQRAEYQISRATNDQIKDVAQVYQSQVRSLAEAMHCDLGGQSQQGHTDMQGGQQGSTNVQDKEAVSLRELITTLPLQMDEIDFSRVRTFVEAYTKFAASSNDQYRSRNAVMLGNQIEQYIQMAMQNTNGSSQTIFRMNGLTADDLVSWAQPPASGQPTRSKGSARALADALWYVVDRTAALVKDLYNSHYNMLADNPDLRQPVEQQAGGRSIPFGSSIAASNLDDINVARSRLPQVGA